MAGNVGARTVARMDERSDLKHPTSSGVAAAPTSGTRCDANGHECPGKAGLAWLAGTLIALVVLGAGFCLLVPGLRSVALGIGLVLGVGVVGALAIELVWAAKRGRRGWCLVNTAAEETVDTLLRALLMMFP